jgi:hypothetical protein
VKNFNELQMNYPDFDFSAMRKGEISRQREGEKQVPEQRFAKLPVQTGVKRPQAPGRLESSAGAWGTVCMGDDPD